MIKKIWNVIQYFILIVLIIATSQAIYLRHLPQIFGGFLILAFWISMMLEHKLPKKNKIVSTVCYTTSGIIILLNIVAFVFNLFTNT